VSRRLADRRRIEVGLKQSFRNREEHDPPEQQDIVADAEQPRVGVAHAEIRDAGARIKLIDDGDITASISAAIRGTNDHLAIGIGGAMEGVIAAAALRCLGGEVQGQLWPLSRTEIADAGEHGIDDIERIFGIDDLVDGHHVVVASGISGGDLLRGVHYFAEGDGRNTTVMPVAIEALERFGRTTAFRFIGRIDVKSAC
jgi:fructose-1,6-bisphosphatase/sedoheptulose 1,7-bisphosphatase-like protein